METKSFSHSRNLLLNLGCLKHKHIPEYPIRVGVLARPANDISKETRKTNAYNDNWFDRLAINHLSKSLQTATGINNSKRGYESLVEAARAVSQNFNPIQQRQVVIQALDKAFPKPILSLIRTLLLPSKFTREYFAVFTTIFFAWLVGPCQVTESEVNGRREKNVVHIKKCRFLEETNCVGMCVNLCKMPSQSFIKDSLGTQVNMIPNFDDMSCDMIFGQDPPASNDEPALKQPCYTLCNNVISGLHVYVMFSDNQSLANYVKLNKSLKSIYTSPHSRQGKEKAWNGLPQLIQRVSKDGTRVSPTFYVLPKLRLIYHHFSSLRERLSAPSHFYPIKVCSPVDK